MSDLIYLRDLVVILSFGILIVIAFNRLKLPAIAGFIVSGMLVGPQGLGLVDDVHHVELLSEIGVALLLFGIGSELPLSKLQRLWKLAVVGGLLQVLLTATATTAICLLIGVPNNSAIFIGLVTALSSTAVVLRGLQQRGEVDAPHGRLILGILVFQDFCVVPIMLAIPILVGSTTGTGSVVLTLAKSLGIILVIMLSAILIVPRFLKLVAQSRQRQLFILAVFVICLGTAWLVTWSGASLAIGAFLAGLVVAGSEYRHQALADMISFREIFASLFFVSVGMLVSPTGILENLVPILLILAGILVGKSLIVSITAYLMRMPPRVCLIAGLALAQVGEFSFVLLFAVQNTDLINKTFENSLMSAAILSMVITPFVMSYGPKLASGLGKFAKLKQITDVESAEDAAESLGAMHGHVIVAGYGFAGRELAHILKDSGIQYVIVDLNIENVRKASQETGNAAFGDVTSEAVLMQLGIERARELVLLINDPAASALAVRVARRLSPPLYITVRTAYLLDIEPLRSAGADDIVASEQEAAVQVASQLLKRLRVGHDRVAHHTSSIRGHSESADS